MGIASCRFLFVWDVKRGQATFKKCLKSSLSPFPSEIISIAAQGEPEETGPFGMKGIGGVAMNGPLPAVANAVADACGVRLCHGPLTPERVLMH